MGARARCGGIGARCAALLLLGLAACTNGTPALGLVPMTPAPDLTVRFGTDIQPIFNAHCTECHSGGFAPQGLNLQEGASWTHLVNVPSSEVAGLVLVAPGNRDQSYLLRKVLGSDTILGDRMPAQRAPLGDAEIELIGLWIDQGAENN